MPCLRLLRMTSHRNSFKDSPLEFLYFPIHVLVGHTHSEISVHIGSNKCLLILVELCFFTMTSYSGFMTQFHGTDESMTKHLAIQSFIAIIDANCYGPKSQLKQLYVQKPTTGLVVSFWRCGLEKSPLCRHHHQHISLLCIPRCPLDPMYITHHWNPFTCREWVLSIYYSAQCSCSFNWATHGAKSR